MEGRHVLPSRKPSYGKKSKGLGEVVLPIDPITAAAFTVTTFQFGNDKSASITVNKNCSTVFAVFVFMHVI